MYLFFSKSDAPNKEESSKEVWAHMEKSLIDCEGTDLSHQCTQGSR